MQQLARDMRQTTGTVTEITAKFQERALLVPQYTAYEEMRKTRYHDMMRSDISEFVSFSASLKLDDMISRAQEREIDLEYIGKRKVEQVQTAGVSAKKPKGFDSRSRGQ